MLALPQSLTQTAATASLAALTAALRQHGGAAAPLAVDASPLQQFDTTALAVLLDLRRQAQALGQVLSVHGLPARLADLARLYGVADLLGDAPASVDGADAPRR